MGSEIQMRRNNLHELNSLKVLAYSSGKESKYLKNIPPDFSYGHIAEIAISAILGYLTIHLKLFSITFTVLMSELLDREGIDFQINGQSIQLKSKFTYEDVSIFQLEKNVFIVNYNGNITEFIKSLFKYLDFSFEKYIKPKQLNHIQMIWFNYMKYYGILDSVQKSKKFYKKHSQGITNNIVAIKLHNEETVEKEEKRMNDISAIYKVYQDTKKFPKGCWDKMTPKEFSSLLMYAHSLVLKDHPIQKQEDVSHKLINKLGLQYGYPRVFKTYQLQPLKDILFGEEETKVMNFEEKEVTNKNKNDAENTTDSNIPPVNIEETVALNDNNTACSAVGNPILNEQTESQMTNDESTSEITKVNNISKNFNLNLNIFNQETNNQFRQIPEMMNNMVNIVSKNYGISRDKWMGLSLSNALIIVQKTVEISELAQKDIEIQTSMAAIIDEVKKIANP
jgi:hypothetical protein